MTELEMVLTGLCIASLVWAAVCHVRMMRAQRGLEESKDRAEAFYNGWVLCTHEVRRLRFQMVALRRGLRRMGQRERDKDEQVRKLRLCWQDAAAAELDRRRRWVAALKHGVRVVARREQEAIASADDLFLDLYNAERQTQEAFGRGYRTCMSYAANDLLALAERYEEAAR